MTVVVPVYRHWSTLEALLTCLRQQTLARHRFRVVLVDNEPGEGERPEIDGDFELLTCTTPGSYAARNVAVAKWIDATDWFVFTDADCRPQTDWLEMLAATISEVGSGGSGADLISGEVVMSASSETPSWAEIYDLVKGIPQREYAERGFAATANLAVDSRVFRRLGFFDASAFSGSDRLFCLAAKREGFGLRFQPLARVRHPARSDLAEVLAKARRIRGAQIARSRGARRWIRIAYAVAPPVLPLKRLWCHREQPMRRRLIAALVQCRLWAAELPEIYRILKGGTAERR